MGAIRKELDVNGITGLKKYNVLFDSGADASFIGEKQAKSICPIVSLGAGMEFRGGSKKKIISVGTCSLNVTIEENGKNYSIVDNAHVIPNENFNDSQDTVIGASTMQKYKIKLQFDTDHKKNKIDLSEFRSIFNM